MSDRLETLLSMTLILTATAMAAVLVHREFAPKPRPVSLRPPSGYMEDWKTLAGAGRLVGDPKAPVQLVEVADLECPFCAKFNRSVQEVRRQFPNEVAYVFVHLPLTTIHRFAKPAAAAAECAAGRGRFLEMVDAIYEKQDSLGLRPWPAYARDAGIGDASEFARCISEGPPPIVTRGASVARRLGIEITPTVVLNGWRYGSTPDDTELVRAIKDLLAGRSPYPQFRSVH